MRELNVLDFLSPVQKGIKREIDGEDETSEEDNEPEQPVLEREEGSKHVVDAMDGSVVRVLLDCVQQDSLLHSDLLILPAHL